ncbi:uncharacterized protein LOC114318337 [Camellia sinensis]|uniref:uncharacterized protein LOC114318337 n=1 Tax=Camellia sinensis TaxID=4442 RepID=UPI0010360EED|nr:uncharacterized protein LOC114318337 [Camellia sinensis]
MFGPPDKRRRDQRCEYHKDHGHTTDIRYALKDHLEELVQGGRLAEYLPKTENPPGVLDVRLDSPPIGMIHMIYSIPPSNDINLVQLQSSRFNPESGMSVKWPRLSNEISFSDAILKGVTIPHNDALVIELRVNKFAIYHILIDQGSTSEIMYYKKFLKLGFTDADFFLAKYLFLASTPIQNTL